MTELRCPFCGKPLQPTRRIEDEYFCENYDCPQTSLTWVGTSSLWKAFANTKKKLDIAVDAIDEILYLDSGKFIQEPAEMWKIAKSAKDKITALKQKDVK